MLSKAFRTVAIASLCLLAIPLRAVEPKDFAGTWVLRFGDRNLFVLTLTATGDGVTGTFERPATFSSSGSLFTKISGGVRQDRIVQSHFADGVLHLTIQNSNDPKDQDSYAMRIAGDQAELAFDDLPPGAVVEPSTLTRAPSSAKVATGWEPNRTYVADDSDTPSAEMKTIYDEDQRVRQTPKIDWEIVNKSDAGRRDQTQKLLAQGALHTGKDFEEAAFVFQHGGTPEDYLLGHTLAMVAVSKGDSSAIWIAAATLDRYLHIIGQKQIFGTQYSEHGDGNWTQEPYDRTLISDALRRQLGVPSQAAQTKQLEAYQNEK